jgi:membrane fusion protein, heavy metal efflux system
MFMNNSIKLNDILSLFFFAFMAMSCGSKEVEKVPADEHHEKEESSVALTVSQSEIAGIVVGRIEQKQISGTVKVNGVLDVPPQQLVSVSAPLGGFLKNTALLEGSRVKKGQMIATIENLEFIQIQQDYLEAKSHLEFAESDYERQQELAKENVNSEKTMQQAKTNYTTWQARYNGLREKLKVINLNPASVEKGEIKSTIHLFSPINGYVTQVNVNIGKFVNPTDVLFEIVDTEHLHAELIVFEKDVPKLKIGQKVRFTLANETKERIATVYLIGREISEERTIQIHCHIDIEDKEMLPGMYLMALVETGGAQVPALPDEAVIDYQGKKYIFIVSEEEEARQEDANTDQAKEGSHEHEGDRENGQVFRMTEIQTGDSELGYTELKLPGDFASDSAEVVIKGAYSLLSKLRNSESEGGHAH